MTTQADITRLLLDVETGREGAMDELMNRVHEDLERMARAQLNRQFGARADRITLEPAALVNESYLRLIRQRKGFDNRGQFFSIATRIMLRVLMDYARSKNVARRGGGQSCITVCLDPGVVAAQTDDLKPEEITVERLAAALEELDQHDSRKADVVRMRVVWGIEFPQIAAALDVSLTTVERDWRFAKVWIAEKASLA